jgi:DNA-binding transcriptional LysR family regulator
MLPGPPDLAAIDLNLLVTLDVLLAERSVTRAARRLGVGQPSVSHALARLRELLGDPLLVRVGRAMVPTARADALAPALARTLAELRTLLSGAPTFDPAASARAFVVSCPDLLAPIVPDVARRVALAAPRATLELRPPITADLPTALGTGGVDLALAPAPREAPGVILRALGTVRWCILARRGHPALRRGRLTLAAWTAHPHVVVRTGSESASLVGAALARAGATRRVGLIVPGFLFVPHAIAATDMLAAAPRELALDVARELDLQVIDPPIPLPAIPVAAIWHERHHADPAHRWLRALVVDAVSAALATRRRTKSR